MRRPRRGWLPTALIGAAAVGGLVALGTWTVPGDPDLWPPPATESGVEILLLDNGFHTDLAVPRAALEARAGPLAEAVRALPPGEWILIGWGDARFYVDQRPISDRVPDGLRAFLRPGNTSVLMLNPSHHNPRERIAADRRGSVRLSGSGFTAMADHIEASLALVDGRARIAAASPGNDARFFASHEHFWIGRLCNHWSAGVLNAAGLPVRPFRAILSSEVMATVYRAELDTTPAQD